MKILMFGTREDEKEAAIAWAQKENVEVTFNEGPLTMETVDLLDGYDAVTTSQTAQFDDTLYEILANIGIKQIAQRSAGYDMFDLDLASQHGLIISNVPSYSPNAIAEYAVTAAMNIIRNTEKIQRKVRAHDFTWNKTIISKEMRSMTVAIIGTGRIGSITGRILNGFGAKVIGYDLYPNEDAKAFLMYTDTLEEAVRQADLISIHMPLTKDNTYMFNADLFAKMKDGVYFVNTARGGIVDTKALLDALNSGKVAAAALDTYENEAPYFPKDFRDKEIEDKVLLELIAREDVQVSQHIAFYTETAVMNLVEGGLNSAKEAVETGSCENRVN
ncbi:D-2-hydroxyacid dehydrogenase [Macrococcoides bohemicum]|uniref:D-2-hydroxyacid dehydrogenase n=1 Tax=Macrococcoides bohemicum TaxID=1903056 RepID=UPI00165E9876|nr:D-2-hydroxyacid dehydrogenase [Macrococcus bohemicus]MBC9874098.1 D-2-hydroxyacid dehydrogenase [Macrococcus bohemicus]